MQYFGGIAPCRQRKPSITTRDWLGRETFVRKETTVPQYCMICYYSPCSTETKSGLFRWINGAGQCLKFQLPTRRVAARMTTLVLLISEQHNMCQKRLSMHTSNEVFGKRKIFKGKRMARSENVDAIPK